MGQNSYEIPQKLSNTSEVRKYIESYIQSIILKIIVKSILTDFSKEVR